MFVRNSILNLGGLIETTDVGAITLFDIDGPLGDLAHYTAAPTTGQTAVSFLHSNAHGDLAAETNPAGTRTAAYTYDPYGAPLESPPADTTSERWTGQWDTKLDTRLRPRGRTPGADRRGLRQPRGLSIIHGQRIEECGPTR